MAIIPSTITAAELMSLSADGNRCELVEGEVIMMSPAGGRHAKVAAKINQSLVNHLDENRGVSFLRPKPGF